MKNKQVRPNVPANSIHSVATPYVPGDIAMVNGMETVIVTADVCDFLYLLRKIGVKMTREYAFIWSAEAEL